MQWNEFQPQKIELAVALARNGAKLRPTNPGNWITLASALLALDDWDALQSCLQGALTAIPDSSEIRLILADALIAHGLYEQALPYVQEAISLSPDDPKAKAAHVSVLTMLNRWDVTAAGASVTPDAVVVENHRLMTARAREIGPSATLRLCDEQIKVNPAHTNAKHLKSIALAKTGRAQEACELMGLDRLLHIQHLECPAGYASADTFRDILASEIRSNPTLEPDPRGKATRDGLQTRTLRRSEATATETLLAQIREAVDHYEKWLVSQGDPFCEARPRRVRLRSWAVIQGVKGRQKSHFHPSGWLSGVYYVAAPPGDRAGSWAGSLLAGALDPEEHGIEPPWGVRRIDPVPGRLVLFPSYLPHATEASCMDAERICVAFDVIPVQESSGMQ